MTAARPMPGEGAGAALRWGACLVLVLGLHAGLALALLRHPAPFTPPLDAPDAIMLDLAPQPAPAAVPEAPPQPAAPPSPDPKPDPEPEPNAEPPFPVEPPFPAEPPPPPVSSFPQPAAALPEPSLPPVPRRSVPPRSVRPPPRPAQASPPRPTPEVPAPSAAPPPAASATPSLSAFPGWLSELSRRLQRAKRYPDTARARDEQGAAAVTFTFDRSGHVLSAKLVRSSGSSALDEEAVAMVRRADPLPPIPAEMPGNTATLTVPVTFSLR